MSLFSFGVLMTFVGIGLAYQRHPDAFHRVWKEFRDAVKKESAS